MHARRVLLSIEEALRAGVPVLVIDAKGELTDLLLSSSGFDPASLLPWVGAIKSLTHGQLAVHLAQQRAEGLAAEQSESPGGVLRPLHVGPRHHPGSTAGEQLHVL